MDGYWKGGWLASDSRGITIVTVHRVPGRRWRSQRIRWEHSGPYWEPFSAYSTKPGQEEVHDAVHLEWWKAENEKKHVRAENEIGIGSKTIEQSDSLPLSSKLPFRLREFGTTRSSDPLCPGPRSPAITQSKKIFQEEKIKRGHQLRQPINTLCSENELIVPWWGKRESLRKELVPFCSDRELREYGTTRRRPAKEHTRIYYRESDG